MASITVAVSGWTSLGSTSMIITAKSTRGVWLVDAGAQPSASRVSGDVYVPGGQSIGFAPTSTLWALQTSDMTSATVGVSPQASGGGGAGYSVSGVDPITAALSSSTTTSGEFVPLAGRMFDIDIAAGVTVQLQRYSDAAGAWIPATSSTWTGPVGKTWQSDRVGTRFRALWVAGSGAVGFIQ
ncbi:hypothetical protein M2322_003872 [Rhodoblastus acidophilus]|uniref:hypothetical protein n=1 Tax=Rhodoblastus acidophilus TaxID=1074 RepID=UPI002224780E|nr:hypothetical protein [Rhodoblastus acidophilus]MCW2318305.1 hypothetical protein [Rhodoblastus acidophilus]